jgi:ABC-type nickel/cobalt efflux system permease component RcnA
MLGFGLSIPVFFATSYAWALWIAAPLLSREVRRRLRARDHDHDHDHDRGHDADGDGDRHRHRHRDHPEET